MRILYLSHCFPYPPDKGDRIRAFHQVRYLAERHQVDVLALTREDVSREHFEALQNVCSSVQVFPIHRLQAQMRSALASLGSRPLTLSYFHSRELFQLLSTRHGEGLERSYDLAMGYSSAMVPYLEALPASMPKVLDMVDLDSAKWELYSQHAESALWRKVYRTEAKRLARLEASICDWLDRVLLTTPRERDDLLRLAPNARCEAVANGVDAELFQPPSEAVEKAPAPTIVFTGQMDYFANVEAVCTFAQQTLPLIRKSHPSACFQIVGRRPDRSVLALASLPGVEVTGEVDDVRPFLWRAWTFVAPLRIARGIQNKVLEAMAAELPCVVSRRVAEGLGVENFKDGEHLFVGSEPAVAAEHLTNLLANAPLRRRVGLAARQCVTSLAPWEVHLTQLEELLELVAKVPNNGSQAPSPSAVAGAARA